MYFGKKKEKKRKTVGIGKEIRANTQKYQKNEKAGLPLHEVTALTH